MDTKSILGLIASPVILVPALAWAGQKYGKKLSIQNKVVGGIVGAGAGWIVSRVLGPVLAPQAAPAAAPAAATEQQQQEPQEGYLGLSLGGLPQLPPPQQVNPFDQFRAPATPQFDTSPANESYGEGSYGRTSYDTSDTEAAMGEAEEMLAARGRNGRG